MLVAGLGLSVVGAALATVIAEAVSAVLCIVYVYRRVPLLQLKREDLHVDRGLLQLTLKHGSVTALQQSCQPIGKLFIQGVINPPDGVFLSDAGLYQRDSGIFQGDG